MTRPYAEVIGDPIAQSKSPLIHNFWLEKLGIDADYRATRVAIDALPAYFDSRRADPDWRGCNVTMPLKQAVAPLIDEIDAFAARAGAINTVVPDPSGLRGGNSDGAGFLEPLGAIDGRSAMACLIGTGGAARGIAVALLDAGFKLDIRGRTVERAKALAEAVGGRGEIRTGVMSEAIMWDREAGRNSFQLLINATSLGMTGHPPLNLSLDGMDASVAVYDIVTSPPESPLLRQARARGMRSFDGLQMLVGQAAVAFERFFGQPAPREHDAELRARLVS
jgi:shikimate dehydrogenase